jgi:predicted adenylyl cyclase CyaB
MARNVELKAKVTDLAALAARVAAIATDGPQEIEQDDTFFACPAGRLKLRRFTNGQGELIFYKRDDTLGPKASFYERTPIANPESLQHTLAWAYGIIGRVRKHRTLYWIGRTRVHLDTVAMLGCFVELEVVLGEAEAEADGRVEAERLMQTLGLARARLIDCAYLDLLVHRRPSTSEA